MVSFMVWPIYPPISIERIMIGQESSVGHCTLKERTCLYRESNPELPAQSSSLYPLSYPDYYYLPVILYGYETWSLTLREEHRLRAFENKVLRRIFVPKRDEVTGGWRKLHNEELRDLYSSPSKIKLIKSRRMRWAGHVAQMGKERNAYMLLVG
jgi:hypothetical protein